MENNQKINLLLVEDDHNLGNLLKEYLEEKEYTVTLAADGKEGLKKFKNGLFDICVLDVMTSTVSPLRSLCFKVTIFPFTRAATIRLPTSVCTA
jgi:CheY-like chemotaxis protein